MTLHYADLRREAELRLATARYSPRRLVLIHTAVSLGASLVIFLLTLLFEQLIANTGGLGSMGTRSILQTAQAILVMVELFILPFWNIGLTRAALCWAKGELAEPPTLLEGFRRMRSVFGLSLLMLVILFGISMVVSYITSPLLMLTSFGAEFTENLESIMQDSSTLDPEILLSDEFAAQFNTIPLPLRIFSGALLVALSVLVWYRIRFADFGVMDGNRSLFSMLHSFRITKKKALQIFKIDLHFWWFFLLQALSVVLKNGDYILTALGIPLPISEEACGILFFVLSILAQGLLLWYYQAKVSTVYGLAYETLTAESELKIIL